MTALEHEHVAREQAERTLAMLDALIVGAPIALAFLDTEFRYVWVNELLAAMNGKRIEEHVGRTIHEVLPQHAAQLEVILRQALTTGKPIDGVEVSYAPPGTPDQMRDWQIHVFPVRVRDGRIIGLGGAIIEITALKQALRVRDEILSFAAHDLRSPLTSMKLLVDGSIRKARQNPQQLDVGWLTDRLTKMSALIDREVGLLNDLLDVSRIHTIGIRLAPEPLDIAEVVRDVVFRHGELLANNGCELRLDARGPLIGHWDSLRLEQVISNLISNAAKYGAGNPVEVRLSAHDDKALLTIRDHGVGIEPENLGRIFGQFERVGNKSAFSGAGLGLWIVKKFLDAMGGTIQVESEIGRGTIFTVELPRNC